MRKKMMAIFLAGSMILSVGGCGKEGQGDSSALPGTKTADTQEMEVSETDAQEKGSEETFSFAEFAKLQFIFSSGAGGWATYLYINADGTFSGEYFDGEMGIIGDDYPDGTMYQCRFTGRFTQPLKVNDFTYSMQIEDISYEKEPGTEEIIDGMLYCYAEPYGLDGAEEILIYMPGAPLAELPEEYKSWVGYSSQLLAMPGQTELPFWGLYNVAEECGFESYDMVESAKEMVAFQEKEADSLEASIENDALTQAEYNEKSQRLYETWDDTLNGVWNALKQTLEEDAMQALIVEEREWIAGKEQAVAEAGAEAGAEVVGGSMWPMVMNLKAAELTKSRVYELLELLEKMVNRILLPVEQMENA